MNNIMNFLKRNTAMLMMAVAVMGGVTSCEEHTDEYDGSLRVGNILLADNSVVSPQGYDAEGKQAIGVIFYCNRDTALVISTHELGCYAYADSLGTVGSVDSDSRTLCGAENTAALLVSEIPTPAAEAVAAFRSPMASWALPSAGELRALAAMLPVVENSMRIIGGEPFDDGQYLSSTQDGSTSESEQMYYLSVAVRSGFVTSTIKTTPGRVRPVLRVR
jgi:hypothetical protein